MPLDYKQVLKVIQQAFNRIQDKACDLDAKVFLFVIPHNGIEKTRHNLPETEMVLDLARKAGFSVVNPTKQLLSLHAPQPLYNGHFSEFGNKMMAEIVLEHIQHETLSTAPGLCQKE